MYEHLDFSVLFVRILKHWCCGDLLPDLVREINQIRDLLNM